LRAFVFTNNGDSLGVCLSSEIVNQLKITLSVALAHTHLSTVYMLYPSCLKNLYLAHGVSGCQALSKSAPYFRGEQKRIEKTGRRGRRRRSFFISK
jgi:hypothetical protein